MELVTLLTIVSIGLSLGALQGHRRIVVANGSSTTVKASSFSPSKVFIRWALVLCLLIQTNAIWLLNNVLTTTFIMVLIGYHLYLQYHVAYVQPPLKKEKLRILYLVEPSPFTYISGLSSRYCNAIINLLKQGHDVILLIPDDGFLVQTNAERFKNKQFEKVEAIEKMLRLSSIYKEYPQSGKIVDIITSLSFAPSFYRVKNYTLTVGIPTWQDFLKIVRYQPDLVHTTSPGFISLGASIIAKVLGVPLVLAYHTHVVHYVPHYWKTKTMQIVAYTLTYTSLRFFHNFIADATLCTSSVVQEELIDNGLKRVLLWERGVDTDSFNPKYKSEEARNRILLQNKNPNKKSFVLVYVGRLAVEKNIPFLKDILLKVVERIDKSPEVVDSRDYEIVLSLIGEGPIRSSLEEHFKNTEELSNHKARVVFVGELRGEDLYSAFASGDIFSFSSETETLGFVVFEAMASGLPVVAPHAGGIPDLITNGTSGFLYKPGNADDAADLIVKFIESKEKREQVSEAARAEAEKWSWGAATTKLVRDTYISFLFETYY